MYAYAAGSPRTFGLGTVDPGLPKPSPVLTAEQQAGAPATGWQAAILAASQAAMLTPQTTVKYPGRTRGPRAEAEIARLRAQLEAQSLTPAEQGGVAPTPTQGRAGLLTNPLVIAGVLVAAAIFMRGRKGA